MERNQIMKKMAVMLVLCGLAATAVAQDWTTTVDFTYVCKYMWRGFDMYNNAGAYQPSVDFRHENGFGANVWMSIPDRGGAMDEDLQLGRWDMAELHYTLYYAGTMGEACYQTNYKIGYRYYDFFKMNSKDIDSHEAFIEAEFPQITGNAIVPHVAVYQMWPTSMDDSSDIAEEPSSTTFYQAGFSCLLPTEEQLPGLPLTFSWDLQFIDGDGLLVDTDWSHMVWGLKTEFDCPMTGAKVIPAAYFQNSFEETVNNEDEFWVGLSYLFTF
jgi:hypothetical protein